MKIGMIGMGFVGGNTAKVLGEKHEVVAYDKYKEPYTNPEALKDVKVVFIAVPTPMKASGEMDYTPLEHALQTLESVTENPHETLVVIRSTIVPGTTNSFKKRYPFRYAFNPEFLQERTAYEDMKNTDRVVIGTDAKGDYEVIKEIYEALFPHATYFHTDITTAEMIKYAANITLTGQVAIANEIYNICQVSNVDYDTVKEITSLDKRLGTNRSVPGHDGDFGFGGKCLPKDLNALIYYARSKQYRPYLLEEMWRLNERVRKKKDWLDIPGAVSENNNFNTTKEETSIRPEF